MEEPKSKCLTSKFESRCTVKSHTHTITCIHIHKHLPARIHRYECTCIHIVVDACRSAYVCVTCIHIQIYIYILCTTVSSKRFCCNNNNCFVFTMENYRITNFSHKIFNIRNQENNERKPSKMEQKHATHWGKQHHKLNLNIQYRQARATLKVNEDNIYLFNTHRIQTKNQMKIKNLRTAIELYRFLVRRAQRLLKKFCKILHKSILTKLKI